MYANNEVFGNERFSWLRNFFLLFGSRHAQFQLSGNTCAKCGDWALHINGAKALTTNNNIFDISTLTENSSGTTMGVIENGGGRFSASCVSYSVSQRSLTAFEPPYSALFHRRGALRGAR